MERGDLDYKVVMDDGPDSELLGRVRDLEFGFMVFTAAVAKHPDRNIQLRQGTRIIKRHDGEPEPVPSVPVDPNLKSWSVNLIGGRKMQHLGFIHAASETAAIEVAVEKFELTELQRKRLAVSPTK
jgi:hypothetical protein